MHLEDDPAKAATYHCVSPSVTTCIWLLRVSVKHTMAFAKQALPCVLTLRKVHYVSNAVTIVAMSKTAKLIDRLQYHVDFAWNQRLLVTQRLQLHFAIHVCITQRILALKIDPSGCSIEQGAQQCRFANHSGNSPYALVCPYQLA